MEVVNPCCALLSNYEVYNLLKETRADYKKLKNNFAKKNLRNANTVAYETLKYFENVSSCRFSSEETIPDFIHSVQHLSLSKAELLQLVNLRPTTHVELHAVLEECEERYSEDQIAGLLETIREKLNSHTRARTSDSVCSLLSADDGEGTNVASLLHNSSLSHEEEVTDSTAKTNRKKKKKKVTISDDGLIDEIVIATDRVKDIQIKNTPSDEPLPEVELIDDIVKDKLKEIDLAKQITEKVEAKLGKEEDSEEEEEIGRKNKKKSVVIMSDEGSGEEVAVSDPKVKEKRKIRQKRR